MRKVIEQTFDSTVFDSERVRRVNGVVSGFDVLEHSCDSLKGVIAIVDGEDESSLFLIFQRKLFSKVEAYICAVIGPSVGVRNVEFPTGTIVPKLSGKHGDRNVWKFLFEIVHQDGLVCPLSGGGKEGVRGDDDLWRMEVEMKKGFDIRLTVCDLHDRYSPRRTFYGSDAHFSPDVATFVDGDEPR